MIVIGLTGLARAGKDTVARLIAKKYGFRVFTFSDVLAEELEKTGRQATKENLSIFGDELRAKHGEGVVGELLLKKIKSAAVERAVANGFRSPAEVKLFRETVDPGRFFLIEVTAPKESRFARKRRDDPQTWEEFFARDARDLQKKGFAQVLQMVDLKIDNDADLKTLAARVDDVVKKLL